VERKGKIEGIVIAHGDRVAPEALGENITPGYYTSPNFIGTVVVRAFLVVKTLLSFVGNYIECDM
jgi:hypothetical protein